MFATRDSIVWRGAYGRAESPLDVDTPFWIGSITKSFTAAAVLVLAHRRALSLDDSLSAFFPETPPDKRRVTIRQLLTHTAGLGSTYTGAGRSSRDATVRAILAQPLARLPGTGYQYEDDSYELLAAVIEVRTGVTWSEFVRRDILMPLGLLHMGFWCRPGSNRQPAPVQDLVACGTPGAPGPADDWAHRGANGMFGTASDLVAWMRYIVYPPSAWRPALGEIGRPALPVREEGGYQVWSGLGARLYRRNGETSETWLSGRADNGHSSVVRAMANGTILVVLSTSGQHDATSWSAYIAERLVPR
jgi:CubicO group peptidase (beta-lactamase class C family)